MQTQTWFVIVKIYKSIFRRWISFKNIVITLGNRGIYFANNNEEYFIDAFKLNNEVIDTTGAGDAFNGALAVALSNDLRHKEALEFANKVAGISTTRIGAANSMPYIKDVEEY